MPAVEPGDDADPVAQAEIHGRASVAARDARSSWPATARPTGTASRASRATPTAAERPRAASRRARSRSARRRRLDAVYSSDLHARARDGRDRRRAARASTCTSIRGLREVDVGIVGGADARRGRAALPEASRWLDGGDGWDDGETVRAAQRARRRRPPRDRREGTPGGARGSLRRPAAAAASTATSADRASSPRRLAGVERR